MSPPTGICQHCAKIDFELLQCPTGVEESLLTSSVAAGRLEDNSQTSLVSRRWAELNSRKQSEWTLGRLCDIKRDSEVCGVCYLFWKILYKHNSGEPDVTWNGRDLILTAKIENYAYFYVHRQSDVRQDLRRMSLAVEVPTQGLGDYTSDSHYEINFCLQAADYDAPELSSLLSFGGAQLTSDLMAYAGRERPLQIDLRLISWWIQKCYNEHAGCKLTKPRPVAFASLRLIDIQKKCICQPNTPNAKYVALSYVWGTGQKLKLTKENTRDMFTPGALTRDLLSRTISDAMYLLEALGIGYLWVDALCIQQNSDADKLYQIPLMPAIYGNASFTLVAASGEHADSGLNGLFEPQRHKQEAARVPIPDISNDGNAFVLDHLPMSIMTTLAPQKIKFDHFLENTTWYTRGWTMQERVLSPRNLIFTAEQVHWECSGGSWCEESWFDFHVSQVFRYAQEPSLEPAIPVEKRLTTLKSEEERKHWNSSKISTQKVRPIDSFVAWRISDMPNSQPGMLLDEKYFKHYSHLVMRYTQRGFSFEKDILHAFAGIMSSLYSLTGETFLWGLPISRFELSLSLWRNYCKGSRQAKCLIPSASDPVETAFPSWSWMAWNGHVYMFCSPRVQIRSLVVCWYLRDDTTHKVCEFHDPRHPRYGDSRILFELQSWTHNVPTRVHVGDVQEYYPSLNKSSVNSLVDSILFFWTTIAKFRICWHGRGPGISSFPVLLDRFGKSAGGLGQCSAEWWEKQGFEGVEYDFILLAMMNDQNGSKLRVLQIYWEDGIAKRLNSGYIEQNAWLQALPKVQLIALG